MIRSLSEEPLSVWFGWARQASLYASAERALRRLIDNPAGGLHAGPAVLCRDAEDTEGTRGVPVLVFVTLSAVRADQVTRKAPGRAAITLVKKWRLDQHAVTVSDDDRTVRFGSVDAADPDTALYLDCANSHGDTETGWWIRLAVAARSTGVEVAVRELRERRVRHLDREPDCPLPARRRREFLDQAYQLEPRPAARRAPRTGPG
jgi:hypothetical protein